MDPPPTVASTADIVGSWKSSHPPGNFDLDKMILPTFKVKDQDSVSYQAFKDHFQGITGEVQYTVGYLQTLLASEHVIKMTIWELN